MSEKFKGISVIIPVFNEQLALQTTLNKLQVATMEVKDLHLEIIIVDDGSEVPIEINLEKTEQLDLRIIRQDNKGRLMARITGLEAAKYEYVILMDSRVHLEKDSLRHLISKYAPSDGKIVLGPTRFPKSVSLLGLFWESISRIVWWRFYSNDSVHVLTEENFNKYPKGTTLLFIPRRAMLLASKELIVDPNEGIPANDDTAVLRSISREFNMVIDKEFDAIYNPRVKLAKFIPHSYHRGKVFIDGFFPNISKTRLFQLLILLTTFACSTVFVLVHHPKILIICCLLCIGVSILWCKFRNLPNRNVASLLIYSPLFIPIYICGITNTIMKKLIR